ncbi:MAG: FAD-binding domain-containing protein [Erythrobacter sp.]
MQFTASRTAALARLSEFLPRAGRAYANNRNHDDGVMRQNVSQLSPWLHAGLIGETEVINTVLGKHSPAAAEKFIAEVFWRVYFKGYLEQRPSVWRAYCADRDAAFERACANAGLRKAYDEAVEGRTGITAFDHWAQELVQTGYLHNHARMWFASIWIFTLKLDWQLGADFFLRHLIDGDAASNTLSWRWVGGLHTKGKTYLARTDNIARYTANHPHGPLAAEGLAVDAPALEEDTEHVRGKLSLPGPISADALDQPFALILHDEAAHHTPLSLPTSPALVIGASRPHARSPRTVADHASTFVSDAVRSGMAEAAADFDCPAIEWGTGDSLPDILAEAGLNHVALPYLPTGWTRDAIFPDVAPMMDNNRVTTILPDLNRETWPHAKAGFFGVKKKIEPTLRDLGITGSDDVGSAQPGLPL